MLQLALIRQQPDFVKERLAVRNFKEPELIDEILKLDDTARRLKGIIEDGAMQLNKISAEIPDLYKKGSAQEAEKKKEEATLIKALIAKHKPDLEETEAKLNVALLSIPNLPAALVAKGRTPEDNVTIRMGGRRAALPPGAMPHWDLAKKYNLIDLDRKSTRLNSS